MLCNRCKDTGIIAYDDPHADSIERVLIACPHCEKGKAMSDLDIPENYTVKDFANSPSWEERDRYDSSNEV